MALPNGKIGKLSPDRPMELRFGAEYVQPYQITRGGSDDNRSC